MTIELVNADFSRRIVIATDQLPWVPSPQPGVERRLLDRIGGEVARATSLVRYAPASAFPPHEHALGEEFLVLEGLFSDERGDYPVGTYVRNPPGSRHGPRTAPGCTILVKLRQMAPSEQRRIVVDTTAARWDQGELAGHSRVTLYEALGNAERVTIERLEAGARLSEADCPGGEEIFVLAGDLSDEQGCYGSGTWIRNPAGYRRSLSSRQGATYWRKRGHLSGAS
ncbi:MAG TPA: cupin domain-containing protein [Steroidobacteraceae bacterium]|nr:cupin domain-containing protein [Steroidobacteraceae bacterium]